MRKKAISPLIATILLIVVAVALIAIVLTWGKSFTTDSLAETTDIIDTSCSGAYINVFDCTVTSDYNAIFYVKNIGTTYTFAATDVFQIDATSDTGTFAAGLDIDDYSSSTWAGIAPGETVQVNLDLNGNSVTGTFFDIAVKSAVCTTDAVKTFKNCHQ